MALLQVGFSQLEVVQVFERMQSSSLKQIDNGSGQCLYKGMGRNVQSGVDRLNCPRGVSCLTDRAVLEQYGMSALE